MSERELIIGLDLRDDYAQLSYALDLSNEVESILMEEHEQKFLIPTAIGLRKDISQWAYGEEALILGKEDKAQVVQSLLDKVIKGYRIKLYGSLYDPIYLLERFIYKILLEIKGRMPDKTIRQMVITIKDMDMILVEGIYKALENLGLGKDRVQVQSHIKSYLSYVLSQEKDIWMNDVALFDFDEHGFSYSQIIVQRRRLPYLVEVFSRDYSKSLKYEELGQATASGNLDYILENIVNDAMYKQIISSIYFTGKGFIDGLPKAVVRNISKGRRVFIGQNLYSKGACYYAQKLVGMSALNDFVFLLDDTISYTVSLVLYDKGEYKTVTIGKLGESIYEPVTALEAILDGEESIKYQVMDKNGNRIQEDILILDNLPKRPNKTTRIEFTVNYTSNSRFKIHIKDKGFGDLYPATNMSWEKEVVIYE